MKKVIIYLLISAVAIVAIIFLVGLMLPKERVFTKTAVLNSDVPKVFSIVTDFKGQTTWRNDVDEIIVIDNKTWIEVPKKGTAITFQVKRKIENQLFEMEIVEPKSFQGYWIGTFEEVGNGTKVVFKEVAIIENPFFRVLSSLFIDLDKTMEIYMNNLKVKLEK
jgi:hypothetical protein